jgi:hypothetical protein
MSKNTTTTTEAFATINPEQLTNVAGGASRSSSGSNSELTAMLTQISSSIKDIGSQKDSGGDTMQMMLMMMMMGGGGGGGGSVAAAPASIATPPVINVDTSVMGGGCRRGKKGW